MAEHRAQQRSFQGQASARPPPPACAQVWNRREGARGALAGEALLLIIGAESTYRKINLNMTRNEL